MGNATMERVRLEELRDRLLALMTDIRVLYEPAAAHLHCIALKDELAATRTSSAAGTLHALTRALDACLDLEL